MATRVSAIVALSFLIANVGLSQLPAPKSPVIPEADGYIVIPKAAVRPEKNHVYKAIFEATQFPDDPMAILPVLNNAGSELNALSVEGVPKKNWKFAVVFHGPAIDGILDDEHYKAKYHTGNPNLKVLSAFKREGVEIFVCGQNLAALKLDPAAISPYVTVASDALIVLMKYQNMGYALLSF